MTEHKAGRLANQIYAAHKAGQIDRKTALNYLDKFSHCLSESQFRKYQDFLGAC